jgi:NADH dehydrogenase FAD-containing subunit
LSYDYLIFALGRRLATEQVAGFFEHAHHLLSLDAALKFGGAVKNFREGRAVIGYCPGARLSVPVFETAFALARRLSERHEQHHARITFVTPESSLAAVAGGEDFAAALRHAMDENSIELYPAFPINRVTERQVWTDSLKYHTTC